MNLLSKLFQSFDKAKASTDGDEFEKRPTSAAHWTDAFQRPVSHRAYRRQRERDANRASKKFYANRKEQLRQQLLSDERDAVWLLSAWEKKQGRRWAEDEDDRMTVQTFVHGESEDRRPLAVTPQQIIDALGITIEDVAPENPWAVEDEVADSAGRPVDGVRP